MQRQTRISADGKLHKEGRTRREKNTFLTAFSIAHLSYHGAIQLAGPRQWSGREQEDMTESRRLLTQGWEPHGINQLRAGGNESKPLPAE